MTELQETTSPVVITQYESLKSDIEILRQEDAKAKFDYCDPKQNKAARSHVYKMRQVRSSVEWTEAKWRSGSNV